MFIQAQLWISQSDKIFQRIKSFFLMTSVRIAGMAVSFLRNLVITKTFGLSGMTDAYYMAMIVISSGNLFFGALGSGILLPLYNDQHQLSRNREQVQKEQRELIGFMTTYMLLIAATLACLVALFPHQAITLLVGNSNSKTINPFFLEMMHWCIPISFILQLSALWAPLLIQQKQYNRIGLPEVISSMIFVGGFWWFYNTQKEWAITWVLPISYSVGTFLYWKYLRLTWRWCFKSKYLKLILPLLIPNLVIIAIGIMKGLSDGYLFSRLSPGSLSAYRNAITIIMMISNLTLVSYTTPMHAHLIGLSQHRNYRQIKNSLLKSSGIICLVCMPFITISYLIAPWLLTLIFKRGVVTDEHMKLLIQCFQVTLWVFPSFAIAGLLGTINNSLRYSYSKMAFSGLDLIIRIAIGLWSLSTFGLTGLLWGTVTASYIPLVLQLIYILYKLNQDRNAQKEEPQEVHYV